VAGAAAVGLIEEGAKFLSVYAGIYRNSEFDEAIDGIVYTVAAGMGFATLENLQYVLAGGAAVGVARMLTAMPGHAFFGALMGYNLGMAKFAGRKETAYLLTGLGAAVVAHAAWDALAFSRSIYALALIPGVVLLWRRAVALSLRAQKEGGRLGRQRVSVEELPAIPPPDSES
jgi:RsiW-degrading membrane proteinase PrsW (M82 family)